MKYLFLLILNIVLGIGGAAQADNMTPSENERRTAELNIEQSKGFYRNRLLGFELSYDPSWVVANQSDINEINKIGRSLLTRGEGDAERFVDEALRESYGNLLMLTRHPAGTPMPDNPKFNVVAENVESTPEISSGKEYLEGIIDLVSTASDAVFQEIEEQEINGSKFYRVDFVISFNGIDIDNTAYAVREGNKVIGIFLTYKNEKQKNEMIKFVNSFKCHKG